MIARKNLARMADQVQQSGQDMVQALPPLNDITLPDLPEFVASTPAIPEKPVLPAPPKVV